MKELTPKQQRFVEEYVVDHNGTRAAIAAGYGEAGADSYAAQLRAKPNIRAAIADREAHIADHLGMTQAWVLENLKEVIEEAKRGRDHPNALRGLDMHMKHRGMYAPVQVEQTGTVYTLNMGNELEVSETSSESEDLSRDALTEQSQNSDLTSDNTDLDGGGDADTN